MAPEKTLARVCGEAEATVRCNAKLREMNVVVAATDEREIEVLASGLPLHHGAQLAVDITLRSALTRYGSACAQADRVNGIVDTRTDETKNTSTRNCSRATDAAWLWLGWRRAAGGAQRRFSSWKCWQQLGHGRHRVF